MHLVEKEIERCAWANISELEKEYHDTEWGTPCHDDDHLFEMLILEGMQAGLSWHTILQKREAMREAFDDFDYHKIAQYDDNKKAELLQNAGIIRNRLKINSLVTNAQQFLEIQKEYGSFDAFIWQYVDNQPIKNHWVEVSEVPASDDLSRRLSKDMKKLGLKFVGETIMYSYMQAIGMIDDHLVGCWKNEV